MNGKTEDMEKGTFLRNEGSRSLHGEKRLNFCPWLTQDYNRG